MVSSSSRRQWDDLLGAESVQPHHQSKTTPDRIAFSLVVAIFLVTLFIDVLYPDIRYSFLPVSFAGDRSDNLFLVAIILLIETGSIKTLSG